MRRNLWAALLAVIGLGLGCGESRSRERGDIGPGPMPLVPEPVGPPGTQSCGLAPPMLASPKANQLVRGSIEISSALEGGLCSTGASVVFTVMRLSGEIVFQSCSSDGPARATWNTRRASDGLYWVYAQRACGCSSVCLEYDSVRVSVDN